MNAKGAWVLSAGLAAFAAVAVAFDETEARFYYDLGPSEVDVSAYPEPARKGFATFSRACSQCHALARPLNSPIKTQADWRRYVRRMHLKARAGGKALDLTKDQASAIVDFLSHDSKVRKVDGAEAFARQTAELRERFEKVKAERAQRRREEGRKKAVPSAPYTGAKP